MKIKDEILTCEICGMTSEFVAAENWIFLDKDDLEEAGIENPTDHIFCSDACLNAINNPL